MQPVSLNNFFKCYPWRVQALQLVFLAAIILILFLRYGFWGPQAADAFTVLRESSPVITAFMNGISDWGNAAQDSVYAAILIRSFLTRDREGILFSLGYAAMAILYLGVTLQLVKYGLVVLTWGNVSGIDREKGLFVIKPSGVPYDDMKASDMVVMDLNGNKVEGDLNPSSDTPTHLELYRSFPEIGGIVHTHSPWACSWAQAGRDVNAYGTTHADFANCSIPCARRLSEAEVKSKYELNTGKVIVEEFKNRGISPEECPAILIHRHGPFTWGKNPFKAVENALILEEVSKMAYQTEQIAALDNESNIGIEQYLLDKHYQRKHGKNAYYGQNK